jgi:hypothetical protein
MSARDNLKTLGDRFELDFYLELSEHGLPNNPALIVGRLIKFTTAIMGRPEGDRVLGQKTPEACLREYAGIELLSAPPESLEASFATPFTLVATVTGISFSDHMGFSTLHIHPVAIEGYGIIDKLLVGSKPGIATLSFEKESRNTKDGDFFGTIQFL